MPISFSLKIRLRVSLEVKPLIFKKGLMISTIYLKEGKDFELFQNDQIDGLSKVNFFVGTNNSGKSTLLRGLFKDDILFEIEGFDSGFVNKRLNAYQNKYGISHRTGNSIYESLCEDIGRLVSFGKPQNGFNFSKLILEPLREGIYKTSLLYNSNEFGFLRATERNLIDLKSDLMKYSIIEEYHFDKIYIPTLRGLRPLGSDLRDVYKETTIKNYFKDSTDLGEIYTGLSFYRDLRSLKLGRHDGTLKAIEFNKFLSENFFNNDNIDLIPYEGKDEEGIEKEDGIVYIKVGSADDYQVYRVGDGVAQIIIMMYPLFFNKDKMLKVFIEEPELYLHPGMQRILLDTLTDEERFPHHQFFFTSHSNHFLDMTADFENISVYSLRPNPDYDESEKDKDKFVIKNAKAADRDVLNLLGVKNSSVFLSNCTIWVEGITDRLYIRKWLELFFEEYEIETIKEDTHYSFVEYAGGNITHWSVLDSDDPNHPNIDIKTLCGDAFVISDRDDDTEGKKKERHERLSEFLEDRYCKLPVVEIENMISPIVLEKMIKAKEGKNADNLVFPDDWYDHNYKDCHLGKYIADNVEHSTLSMYWDDKKERKGTGTIRYKAKFSKRVVRLTESFDDLSQESVDLCIRLAHFICDKNNLGIEQGRLPKLTTDLLGE